MLLTVIAGIEGVFWAAFACCTIGALCRDRTALALFLANGCAYLVDAFGVPFGIWAWASLDVVTAWMIMRPGIGRREIVIVSLFLPCWAAYLLDEPWRYMVATGLVTLQMFIVTPLGWLRDRARTAPPPQDLWDNFLPLDARE